MLNDYSNTPKQRKTKALAAVKAAQDIAQNAPMSEAELLDLIEVYNQAETAAYNLKGVIFAALEHRKGYKRLMVGPDAFNGSPEAVSQWEMHDPARLIKVDSLGSE